MEEKRKNRRTPLKSKIIVKRINADTAEEIGIEIVNVSQTGVGFNSDIPLEIGNVYESYLTIWTKEVLHAFIEIVRIEKKDGIFNYGGTFVGMPEMDQKRIEIYQTFH